MDEFCVDCILCYKVCKKHPVKVNWIPNRRMDEGLEMKQTKVTVYVEKDAIEVSGLTFVKDDNGDYVSGGLTLREYPKESIWILYSDLHDIKREKPEDCLIAAFGQARSIHYTLFSVVPVEEVPGNGEAGHQKP